MALLLNETELDLTNQLSLVQIVSGRGIFIVRFQWGSVPLFGENEGDSVKE